MNPCPHCGNDIPNGNKYCSRKCYNLFNGRGEDAAIWDGHIRHQWDATGKPIPEETLIKQETMSEAMQKALARPKGRIIKETKISVAGIKPGMASNLFLYATEGDYICPIEQAKGKANPYVDQNYCESFCMGEGCAEIEKGCPAYCKNTKR